MAYTIEVYLEYMHIIYTGKLDALDIVSILSVDEFINNARRLKHVIYDYSSCVNTNFTSEDIRS